MKDEEIQIIVHDHTGRTILFMFRFISIPQENNIHTGKNKTKLKITNLKAKDVA